MRLLYVDVDCLRPDHLGCYGYPRRITPHIDEVARQGFRFDNVYASDVPCLPSRAAFMSGRFGIHTGVVNHGGAGAEPFAEGEGRGFNSLLGRTSFVRVLRDCGYYTGSVSSFAERHGAFFFHAGFHDIHNPGRRGLELADEVAGHACRWLDHNARRDRWFLHVNFWDPHTPYRTPAGLSTGLVDSPAPEWLTEEVRQTHFAACGPHSAREVMGYDDQPPREVPWNYPGQPLTIDSPAAVRRMFDGYDAGVLNVDHWLGALLAVLDRHGVLDDTAIVISADHGEALGELNVYGDHHNADQSTCRVPMLLRWPGLTNARPGLALAGLHYQFDVFATILELLGAKVPSVWDAVSFAPSLRAGRDEGREALVLSQAAWTCQRSVRFVHDEQQYLCIRTYHDGHHGYPDTMLFDLERDPHQQHNLAENREDVVRDALARLERWLADAMCTASHPADPMWTVLHEGGPKHVRGHLPRYLERLRSTGRGHWAALLQSRHAVQARNGSRPTG